MQSSGMGRSCRAKVSFAAGAGAEAGGVPHSASSRAAAVTAAFS